MMTGTMYLTAMREASTAAQKQSLGGAGAMTGIGASELGPKRACSKWACSGFVGSAVEGPPRWISQMTSGISTATARPIASVFSAMPGPEVVVMASAPAYAAPMAEVMAAISSSAWKVMTPKSLYWDSSCKMSDAGVMG